MLLKRLNDNKAVILASCLPAGRKAGIRLLFLLFFFAPSIVLAAPAKITLPNPLGTTNILDLGARLIQAGLGIAGSLALLFFIYGGFLWLTSGGVPDKIKKGRDVFLWSTVGLVIIFSSYLMVDFVIKALTKSKVDQTQLEAQNAEEQALESCLTSVESNKKNQIELCNSEFVKQGSLEALKSANENCKANAEDGAVIQEKKCWTDAGVK